MVAKESSVSNGGGAGTVLRAGVADTGGAGVCAAVGAAGPRGAGGLVAVAVADARLRPQPAKSRASTARIAQEIVKRDRPCGREKIVKCVISSLL